MKKRRILLLRAGLPSGRSKFLVLRSVCPPLGLIYLAAAVRRQFPDEFELRVLDPGLDRLPLEEVVAVMRQEAPEIVGISAMATEVRDVNTLARAAREALPGVRVVVGGPCTQTVAASLAANPDVDCCVIGEGEATFVELVPLLLAGSGLQDVKGICFRTAAGEVVTTQPRPPIEFLDSLSPPAWDLIDLAAYSERAVSMNYGLLAARPYAPIFTSRGCPYRCTYCHGVFGKKARFRSPTSVLAEMALLVERHGVREFHIYDDIFNLDAARAAEILDGIAQAGWNVKLAFPNGVRGDLLTADLLARFRRAGTYLMCFAVETASDRLQRLVKKNLDLDKVRENISLARREGIIPLGFFMLGFPTETVEELQSTIDWACQSDLLRAFFFNVVPYRGTEIADLARDLHPRFDFDPTRHYHQDGAYFREATGVDLASYQRRAYLRFYLDLGRIVAIMRTHPAKRGIPGRLWRYLMFALPGAERYIEA
ncbi:MAG: cobalamin B12-binding domain-containing protein [Candidatus Riflebacteria bacterium]|nr:cobalamin B12-binding domain-containing protein [Candidatus Riflebacteria bacterium]